jgi:hypothetical protein
MTSLFTVGRGECRMAETCLEGRPQTSQALAALEFIRLLVDEGDVVVEGDLDQFIDAKHSDAETAEIVATLALWLLSHHSVPVPERQRQAPRTDLAA